MGKILRRKSTTSGSAASGLLLLLVLVCAVQTGVGQTASAQIQAFDQNVKSVHFPFDIYSRIIDMPVLEANSAWLKQNSGKMWIQGYADPRGDIVYNLVLSYHRAQFVKTQLGKRGVDVSNVEFATGWGKLYQTCDRSDEKCWHENRRVDVVPPEALMFHWATQ